MMRLSFCAAIIVSGAVTGAAICEMMKKRIHMLRLLTEMCDEILLLLEFRAPDIYEIVRCLASNEKLSRLSFLKEVYEDSESGTVFKDVWKIRSQAFFSYMPSEVTKNVLELGADLGTCALDGQLAVVNGYRKFFESEYVKLEKQYESKGKLVQAFGIFAGAFIAIALY